MLLEGLFVQNGLPLQTSNEDLEAKHGAKYQILVRFDFFRARMVRKPMI